MVSLQDPSTDCCLLHFLEKFGEMIGAPDPCCIDASGVQLSNGCYSHGSFFVDKLGAVISEMRTSNSTTKRENLELYQNSNMDDELQCFQCFIISFFYQSCQDTCGR